MLFRLGNLSYTFYEISKNVEIGAVAVSLADSASSVAVVEASRRRKAGKSEIS